MKSFAALLDKLVFEPSRNNKLRWMVEYFRETPDPDRGYALAALTGSLRLQQARPAFIRKLLLERVDPQLFALSYDFVGDLAETVALMWPPGKVRETVALHEPSLTEIVEFLHTAKKSTLEAKIVVWMDELEEAGRWALLKLITGGLRIGVSARLAKTAIAHLGNRQANEVEEVWHGLAPPYTQLFAWIEGRGSMPEARDAAPFRPPMLAHPIDAAALASLAPGDFAAEWKWDGIRVQAVGGRAADGTALRRLYSRSGDDVSAAFSDIVEAISGAAFDGACIDGELLVVRDGVVQPFGELQQRLNRKTTTLRLLAEFPLHIRAYDLLTEAGEDLRDLDYRARRARLAQFVATCGSGRIDLSPLIEFDSWEALAATRLEPTRAGADAAAVEGVMLKRKTSTYLPGRPTGVRPET